MVLRVIRRIGVGEVVWVSEFGWRDEWTGLSWLVRDGVWWRVSGFQKVARGKVQ